MSENKGVNKMVENTNSRPMEVRIGKGDLFNELKRIELMSFWKKMSDEQKLDYIRGRADYDIVEWHYEIMEGRRKCSFTFAMWKEIAETEFKKSKKKIGDVYRLRQRDDEKTTEFIMRVEKESKEFLIPCKEQSEIVAAGLRDGLDEVKAFILRNYEMDEESFDKINQLEEICKAEMEKLNKMKALVRKMKSLQIKKKSYEFLTCYTCKKQGHIAKDGTASKKVKKTNGVNEVREDEDDLDDILEIKDSLVYLNNEKFNAIFDSDAKSNFLSKTIVNKLELEVIKNSKPVKLYTCLDEEFECSEHVIVDMSYRNSKYKVKFHILPKVEREKILIGRVSSKTMMRNLKHNYECEINTNPGERVVERIYSLPKKLQAGIDKAMKNLIEKKYIQKSQST